MKEDFLMIGDFRAKSTGVIQVPGIFPIIPKAAVSNTDEAFRRFSGAADLWGTRRDVVPTGRSSS